MTLIGGGGPLDDVCESGRAIRMCRGDCNILDLCDYCCAWMSKIDGAVLSAEDLSEGRALGRDGGE